MFFRCTEEDEYLPFFAFTNMAQEFTDQKKLKDVKGINDIGDGFVNDHISKLQCHDFVDSKTKQKFNKKEIVYSKLHQEYVQIKNFEEKKMEYLCRFLKSKSGGDKNETDEKMIA